jgi:uncharacterized protein (TIGR03084 family)
VTPPSATGGKTVLEGLSFQHFELADLLRRLSAEDWQRPTRCEGWNVSDVVLHLAQTDEMAIASLEDRVSGFIAEQMEGAPGAASVDDGAAAMVERERGLSPADLFDRWCSASARLDEMLQKSDPRRRVTWVAGQLSVRTLATTRLAECWIHTGDIAEAVRVVLEPDDRLRHIARLAWRTLPYAFAREGKQLAGPVAFQLHGPGGGKWVFEPEEPASTVVRGDGVELCLVAARRLTPAETGLTAEGPDADDVLGLVRTYA